MISVHNLTKDFAQTRAVDGVSFGIESGEIVGFLGPNGAGKSTTIRILTGYLPATRGQANVAGFDVFHNSLQVRQNIGYLPESVPLYPELRVREYLRFRGRLKGMPRRLLRTRIEAVIEQCGLTEMVRKSIGALSRGYRQRVGLAEAIIAQPAVLILDEPTTGLDPIQRIEIKNLIRSLTPKSTILFSSHILPEVESVCERVILIHRGKIVADGKLKELVENIGAENRFQAVILAPQISADVVIDEIKIISGVTQAYQDLNRQEGNGLALIIEGQAGVDIRASLFELIVQKGWILLELSKVKESLETIFAKLTFGMDPLPVPKETKQ